MKKAPILLTVICGAIFACSTGYNDIAYNTTKPTPTQPKPTNPGVTATMKGWAEMPAKVENPNWEYGYHSTLPSNSQLRNYSFCFDKEKYCSVWVAYPLHSCYLGDISRDDKWRYDPCCIDDRYEPDMSGSYKLPNESSIYDRGHHMPSADRTKSEADNLSTFYATNVTPQLAGLNRGKWSTLEKSVRSKWICADTIYVVSGAHFEKNTTYTYTCDAGGNGKRCPVPTHYYKVILRTKQGDSDKWVVECSADELMCVGFWFENKSGAERQPMSVSEIERKTGMTFFTNVPNAPKEIYNASDWE